MKQKLVRMSSLDGLELPGLLYTPNKNTNKIVIHVHGLNGNFYENKFLDYLAQTYTDKNYAFLTFNNRGKDYITEMQKGNEAIIIGGSLEKFIDCILDIDGVVNWAKEKGYNEITLEGHSYGCNKVLYYYAKKKDSSIKNIVLLGPCDIPSECTKSLSPEEYQVAKEESTRLVQENKEDELINFSIMANGKIRAGTYYYDFLPGGENDFLRYREGTESKSSVLNSIEIPVIIIFGDEDECVLTENIDTVRIYLENNIKNHSVNIIKGTDHYFTNKYTELCKIIDDNIQ